MGRCGGSSFSQAFSFVVANYDERVTTPATLPSGLIVRWANVTSATPEPDALTRLGEEQRRRHAVQTGRRAELFLTGRSLAADLLDELAPDHSHELTSTCPFCGEAHGALRAVSAPVLLSVSYAGPWVAVGAIPKNHRTGFGLDLALSPSPHAPLLALAALFAPAKPPTAVGWTRIEAALKADGRGLQVDPTSVRLSESGAHLADRTDPIRLFDIDAPAGLVITAALAE